MKKINSILFGALLLGAANCTLFADVENVEECATQSLMESDVAVLSEAGQAAVAAFGEAGVGAACAVDEAEKWQYLEKHFAAGLDKSGLRKKIGHLLGEYSGLFATFGVGALLFRLCTDTRYNSIEKKNTSSLDCILDKIDDFLKKFVAREGGRITIVCTLLVISIITIHLVSREGLQFAGKKLENRSGQCRQLLEDFVKNWDKNKAQTPTALQPLFEDLSNDLKANGGKFAKIDGAVAQRIVESLIATSLVASLAK